MAAMVTVFVIIAAPIISYLSDIAARKLNILWASACLKLLNVELIVKGKVTDLRNINNGIIIANHRSYLDIPVLLASVRVPVCWAVSDIFKKKMVFGWHLNRLHLFVKASLIGKSNATLRDAKSFYKKSNEIINRGVWLALFPEGGINRNCNQIKIRDFNKGAFVTAKITKKNIWAVIITGTDKVWSPSHKFPTKGKVTVQIMKLFDIDIINKTDSGTLAQNANKLMTTQL
jgi:1-acyl-sn-glycerol-3-phosphate acyltransferase